MYVIERNLLDKNIFDESFR